jgi:hypothetical protein
MARPVTPVMSLRISVSFRFICSRAFADRQLIAKS